MKDTSYEISAEGEQQLDDKLARSKKEVVISSLITIILPLGFIALKSDFYKDVTLPAVFAGIVGMLIGIFGMIRVTFQRYFVTKSIVKKIQILEDSSLITTFGGKTTKILSDDFKIYEGYRGNAKMKEIFDEPTFRLENYKEGQTFYIISLYWNQWDEIKSHFAERV